MTQRELAPRRERRALAAVAMTVALVATALAVALDPGRSAGATATSPLLFGENLDLYAGTTSSDTFLSQPKVRAGLVNAGTQIIRVPIRGASPSTAGIANWAEVQLALQDVKALGLTPLVILRNPQDPTLLADDTQVVQYVNSVFGTQQVYYEWANETDLAGASYVSASTYLASWNADVPQLKTLANTGAQFIGPVNYQLDTAYLQTFLAGANPLPDAISWHMYTCNDATATEAQCLANIDNWTTDLATARTLMTSTIGKQLPIWITEWNYTPTVVASDSKHTDTAFLQQWTTKALQTLSADGVAASMHFNVNNLSQSDGSFPLVNLDGTLAPEGIAFAAQYTALVGSGSTGTASASPSVSGSLTPPGSTSASASASASASTSASASASASASPTTSAVAPKYSFEDGTLDGWSSTGNVTSLVNSIDVGGQDGTHALEVIFHSTGVSDYPYIHVNPTTGPAAGQTLTAYVYIPTGTTTTVYVKLYVQDPSYTWHTSSALGTLISQRGSWAQVGFALSGYSGNALQVGIQFEESPYSTATTMYVDSVNWS
jgi:hypothetical protein